MQIKFKQTYSLNQANDHLIVSYKYIFIWQHKIRYILEIHGLRKINGGNKQLHQFFKCWPWCNWDSPEVFWLNLRGVIVCGLRQARPYSWLRYSLFYGLRFSLALGDNQIADPIFIVTLTGFVCDRQATRWTYHVVCWLPS